MKYIQDFSYTGRSFQFKFCSFDTISEEDNEPVISIYIDDIWIRNVTVRVFIKNLGIPTEVLLEAILHNKIEEAMKEETKKQ